MEPDEAPRRQINLFGRKIQLPQSPWLRIAVGVLLIIGGVLGFLPILGFWMIPLGLVVLSTDIPVVRRWRRRAEVAILRRWRRWRAPADGGGAAP